MLSEHETLYGMSFRDATLTDLELCAEAGFHVIWLDFEHGYSFGETEILRLGRSIAHLGMVPMVRIPELSRTHVQRLLDGGFEIMVLPDIQQVRQAEDFVRLAKYPPLGQRGFSSTSPNLGFASGSELEEALAAVNAATHLMVQVESDLGLANLEAVLQTKGIDMVAVGPMDWSIGKGMFGPRGETALQKSIDEVIGKAAHAGKIATMVRGGPEEVQHYVKLGVRLVFVGLDVTLKRNAYRDALSAFQRMTPTSTTLDVPKR